MSVFGWLFVISFLAVVGWLWSFLFRTEKPTFRCVGCGKCAAAGECVLMREERERQQKLQMKNAAKNAEKSRERS